MPQPDDILRIATGTVDGATLLTLEGELDIAGEAALTAALAAREAAGDATIAVDLSALEFMDSTGSRVLIEAHQRAEAEDRRFVIVAGPGPARDVIERSGLIGYLAVVGEVSGVAGDRPLEEPPAEPPA